MGNQRMNSLMELNIALAEAVIEHGPMWDNSGPYQSEQLHCRYCYEVAKNDDFYNVKHDNQCPYLIAEKFISQESESGI
jgi:hypothetical protein